QGAFFVPGLETMFTRYGELAEVNADAAAVRASAHGEASLASALLAFDAAAPAGLSGISIVRIDALVGESPRWRPPRRVMVGSLIALGLAAGLISQAGRQASLRTSLGFPFLSNAPCVVVVTLLASLLALAAASGGARLVPAPLRRRLRQTAR